MISRLCSDLPFSIWTVAVFDGDGGGSGSGGSSTGTSPAEGYGQAAASMSAAGIGSVGGRSTGPTGPSASSPAGGAQAAAGFTDGSRSNSTGPGPSASSGRSSAPSGPAASSPAGGAQAAGGFTDGSRGPGPAPSSASFGGGGGPSSTSNAPSAPSQSGTASVGQSSPAAPAPSIAAPAGLFSAAGQTPASAPAVSPATMAAEYGRAAASMRSAGIGSIGGMGLYSPSAREAQEASMAAYEAHLAPYRDALLDTIAGPESAGRYDVMYSPNGTARSFTNFDDHPRSPATISSGPNRGKKSSAAGRYQFIEATWDDQASKLGLKDFSPKSQDRAAYNLAKETYSAKTGRNLDLDIQTNDPSRLAAISTALASQWSSLPTGVEATTTTGRFASSFNANLDARQAAANPNGVQSATVNGFAATPTSNAPVPTGRPDVEVDTADNPYAGIGVSNETFGRMQSGTPQPGLSPTGRTPPSPTAAPTQAPSVVPAQQAPTSTPRSFASTYLDPQQPTAPPAEPATPSRNSSLGRTLASTAIDVGVGAVPGLGVAASAVNLGLQIAGRPSIGQMAVDAFSSSPGWQDAPQTAARDGGDVAELPLPANMTETERAVVQERVQDFASTYLGFRDDTKRPTPREKWGDRSRYAAREYAA